MRARIIGAVCGALVGSAFYAALFLGPEFGIAVMLLFGVACSAVAGFCCVWTFQQARAFRQKYGHSVWEELQ